jgi:hypothetical protein
MALPYSVPTLAGKRFRVKILYIQRASLPGLRKPPITNVSTTEKLAIGSYTLTVGRHGGTLSAKETRVRVCSVNTMQQASLFVDLCGPVKSLKSFHRAENISRKGKNQ